MLQHALIPLSLTHTPTPTTPSPSPCRYWGGTDYIIRLRSALNTAGHTATRIVVPDGGGCSDVSQAALTNASFASAVYALGEHYPCKRSCPAAVGAGLAFWASEDFSTVSDWKGAGCWGRSLSQNWVLLNSTSTISWSTIWSVYPKDSYFGNGLMYAFSPWSGSYTVNPAIWTSAHHTQFMQVGWHLLQGPAGKGLLPGGGSYVTATSPDLTQFTLVLESLQGNCLRCSGGPTQPQNLTFTLTNGLPAAGSALKVWQTTEAAPFVALPDVTVSPSGTLTVFLPADAMLTVSTIATAQHGDFPATPIPSDAPFPLPYSDTFEGVAEDSLPRYFADQAGSFAVRAGVVQQVVGEDPGPNGWVGNRDPVTYIGDAAWTDVAVSVDVRFNGGPPDGQLQAGVPLSRSPLGAGEAAALAPCSPQLAPYQAWAFSAVAPGYLSSSSPSPTCLNAPGCSTTLPLIYWDCVTTGCACGCPSFTNLQWAFNASTGALSSGMDGRQCVSLAADGSLVLRACAPGVAPGQRWAYSASSGQLTLPPLAGGTPLCLTAPAPAPGYAGITARMATYQTRTPGYQFLAVEDGSWRLLAAQAVIANGTLAPGFNSSATHTLGFTVKGSTLTGSVDGAQVFSVQDSTFGAGQVGLGSGYHYAAFDNFSVKPAA